MAAIMPDGSPTANCKEQRQHAQLHGDAEGRQQKTLDRLAARHERGAEAQTNNVAQPDEILLIERLAEAKGRLHLRHHRRRRLVRVERAAGQRMHCDEGDAGHDEKDRDEPDETSDDDLKHDWDWGLGIGD